MKIVPVWIASASSLAAIAAPAPIARIALPTAAVAGLVWATLPRRPGSLPRIARDIEVALQDKRPPSSEQLQVGPYAVHISRIPFPTPLAVIRLTAGRVSCEIEIHDGRTVRVNQRAASALEQEAGDRVVQLLQLGRSTDAQDRERSCGG